VEITTRDLITVVHGMGFGALFMLAFSGALAQLHRLPAASVSSKPGKREHRLLAVYLIGMVVPAWLTVLSGAYVVYPWYRAVPPAGATDLADYPRRLLLASGHTSEWHNVGMEWKENVAWLAPLAMTMVAYVTLRYSREIVRSRTMRTAVIGFALAAFIATGIAGMFGAFLNKYAPVRGGSVIVLMEGET
jgi:MFS family permease